MAPLAALPAWVLPAAAGAAGAAVVNKAMAPKAPSTPAAVTETQQRAEARAEAQTREEAARLAARRRASRAGGLRLLMAPGRLGMNTRTGTQSDTFGVKVE